MSEMKAHWPQHMFATYEGPEHKMFSWLPCKLWDGSWSWFGRVYRRAAVVNAYLQYGGDVFFVYSKHR